MANETEIERMVARLMGDGTSFHLMMKTADASIELTVGKIEKAGKKVEDVKGIMEGFAQGLTSAFSFIGITSSLKGMLDKFGDFEMSVIRMTAGMEVHGRSVEQAMGMYNEFISTMSRTTTTSAGTTRQLLAEAEAHGVTGQAAMDMARRAIQLSYGTGASAESAMNASLAAAEGRTQAMRRVLGPAARGMRDNAEIMAMVNTKMAVGANVMEKAAGTSAGQLQQLKNSLSGLSTELGGIIATAINPFVDALKFVVALLKALPAPIKGVLLGVLALNAGMSAWGGFYSNVLTPMGQSFAKMGGWIASAAKSTGLLTVATYLWGVAVKIAGGPIYAIVGGIILVGTLLAGWITSMGGFKNAWNAVKEAAAAAWDWIKTKAQEFWTWFKPVWTGAVEIFRAVWGAVSAGAKIAWDIVKAVVVAVWDSIVFRANLVLSFINGVWRGISGQAKVDWASIKDNIIETFIAVEFWINQFSVNASLAFKKALEASINFFVETVGTFRRFLPGWATSGMLLAQAALGAIRNDIRDQEAQLEPAFQAFRERRLREIRNHAAGTHKAGEDAAKAYNDGFAKEAAKFEYVLYGTAEAARRVFEYRQKILDITPTTLKAMGTLDAYSIPGLGGPGSSGALSSASITPGAAAAAATPAAAAAAGQTLRVELMPDVLNALNRIANNTGRFVGPPAPANLSS